MSPKKLLRFKDACSNLEDFHGGLRFQKAIDEKEPE
jgi:2-oxoglutarate dehydrogenase complex dehydrogenase (E1) component-like enzyme